MSGYNGIAASKLMYICLLTIMIHEQDGLGCSQKTYRYDCVGVHEDLYSHLVTSKWTRTKLSGIAELSTNFLSMQFYFFFALLNGTTLYKSIAKTVQWQLRMFLRYGCLGLQNVVHHGIQEKLSCCNRRWDFVLALKSFQVGQ